MHVCVRACVNSRVCVNVYSKVAGGVCMCVRAPLLRPSFQERHNGLLVVLEHSNRTGLRYGVLCVACTCLVVLEYRMSVLACATAG